MRVDIGGGVRLYFDVDGCGLVPRGKAMHQKPTRIVMHGGPGFDHSSFKPAFSQFTDIAQVVFYDHRGHGRSDPRPREEWTLDTWADDIVRLCDALGIEKPIVLGQSFGGMVAQKYIDRHPAHPSKVIISSTSPRWVLQRKLDAFARKGGEKARQATYDYWTHPNLDTFKVYWDTCRDLYNTQPAADAMGSERTKMTMDILLDFAEREIRTMELRPGLAKAQCPVLVMAGEEAPICPIEDALEIVEALPKQWVQFARFPNVGHGAWRDDPDAAFAVLREFITQ